MLKQITEQLELPLEHIYQLAMALPRAGARMARKVPNIPAMVQLPLKLEFPHKVRLRDFALVLAGIAIGAAAVIGAYLL